MLVIFPAEATVKAAVEVLLAVKSTPPVPALTVREQKLEAPLEFKKLTELVEPEVNVSVEVTVELST